MEDRSSVGQSSAMQAKIKGCELLIRTLDCNEKWKEQFEKRAVTGRMRHRCVLVGRAGADRVLFFFHRCGAAAWTERDRSTMRLAEAHEFTCLDTGKRKIVLVKVWHERLEGHSKPALCNTEELACTVDVAGV